MTVITILRMCAPNINLVALWSIVVRPVADITTHMYFTGRLLVRPLVTGRTI